MLVLSFLQLYYISYRIFLQINYNPYFFELHLRHEVEEAKNKAVINNGVICVYFVKCEHTHWGSIEHADSKDKVKRYY